MCADDTVGKPFVAQLLSFFEVVSRSVADTYSPKCVLGMPPEAYGTLYTQGLKSHPVK